MCNKFEHPGILLESVEFLAEGRRAVVVILAGELVFCCDRIEAFLEKVLTRVCFCLHVDLDLAGGGDVDYLGDEDGDAVELLVACVEIVTILSETGPV